MGLRVASSAHSVTMGPHAAPNRLLRWGRTRPQTAARRARPRPPNPELMMDPTLSVIAPCFNEELNVEPLCERMLAVFDRMPIPAELLLIDDGSKDRTWDKIEEASRK